MQRMLCDHGVFPHVILNLSLKERILMCELLKKESKELDKLSGKER